MERRFEMKGFGYSRDYRSSGEPSLRLLSGRLLFCPAMAATAVIAEAPEATALEWSDLGPLTVDSYYKLLDDGLLVSGDPVELVFGYLVLKDRGPEPPPTGRHLQVVEKLARLARLLPVGCDVWTRGVLCMNPYDELRVDAAIVRGASVDYADRPPRPCDVSALIEVVSKADDSLQRVKKRLYFLAGIPQYVLVMLSRRRVEYYEQPSLELGTYVVRDVALPGEPVPLLLPDGSRLEVDAAEWVG